MADAIFNLTGRDAILRGRHRELGIAGFNPDDTSMDWTGSDLRIQLRSREDGSLVTEWSTTGGEIEWVDEGEATATVVLTAAVTEAVAAGDYDWDMARDPGDGELEQVWEGMVEVRTPVTRDF